MPPQPPKRAAASSRQESLVKHLVSAGLGSRRSCAALIVGGRVTVNERLAESLAMPVRLADRVAVDGRPVVARASGYVYLLLNKPVGYLSTVRDDRGRRTVMDLVPQEQRRPGIVPAGRLDLDSTGLMLLTDDGELVNRVTHPRYEVQKEYHVRLEGPLKPADSAKLRSGVPITSGVARAGSLRRLTGVTGYRYTVTLVEGKKREVRLMFCAVGGRVLELERVRIGHITVGALMPGAVRELSTAELTGLRRMVGLVGPTSRPREVGSQSRSRGSRRPPGRRAADNRRRVG